MHNTSIPSPSSGGDTSLARWWRRLISTDRMVRARVPLADISRSSAPPPSGPQDAAVRPVVEEDVAARPAPRADDRADALLDRLRLAVLITDAHGVVTFANDTASSLLGLDAPALARGRTWDRLLRVSDEQRAGVRARLRLPGGDSMLPTSLETAGGRSLHAQLDIQPHPHDPDRRLWVLYDAWDAPEPIADEAAARSGPFSDLVGRAPVMRLVVKQLQDVAPVDVAVLVEGETGTGKELVARAIHRASGRRDRPFVAVNCAGLTESLLSSQLFGHRRGAFTGAIADQAGLFEAAHGGTLFLDEIGDMPLSMQTSLLRALQEREIVRLGESQPRPIDVRVIAATHHDLERDVATGRFRRDLFYRIHVAHLVLPPLRQRREDVPALASTFLRQFLAASGRPPIAIGRDAMDALCAHDWPGNVRELRSVVESAALMARDALIRPADLLPVHGRRSTETTTEGPLPVDSVEAIALALKRTGGNRAQAARLLGLSRSTFYRRLAEQQRAASDR